jgi:hypothetical protein
MMEPELEIIIPVRQPGSELALTTASLAAQTDRRFGVVLGDAFSRNGTNFVDTAQWQLAAAGIAVRRVKPPLEMKRLEYMNWIHAQAQAEWLKPLLPGEQLQPGYVERLRQRLSERPKAKLVRCDLALGTEWGTETLAAPFTESALSAAEVLSFFPAQVDWLARSTNFAYSRTAWLALGGYSAHLPNCAALNLNVLLALHYGLENIGETLAAAELAGEKTLNENRGGRVNHSLELWLILRQVENYCLAAKLPWSARWLFLRGWAAALGRW